MYDFTNLSIAIVEIKGYKVAPPQQKKVLTTDFDEEKTLFKLLISLK